MTYQVSAFSSTLEIYQKLGSIFTLVETVENYSFSEGQFHKTLINLVFTSKGISPSILNLKKKCKKYQTYDPLNKICVTACPVARPFRLISKGVCLSACPSGTTNTNIPAGIQAVFGSQVCLDISNQGASSQDLISDCEVCFGGTCLLSSNEQSN